MSHLLRPSARACVVLLLSALPAMAQTPAAPATAAAAPLPPQGSAVWSWDEMVVKPTGVGQRRDITDRPTATFERFECHISTLNAGLASHLPHTHAQEEVIFLKEGELDVHINGEVRRVGAGSLFFFGSNDPHAVSNPGKGPATYLVFNFATAVTRTLGGKSALGLAAPGKMGSRIFEWDQLEVKPTKVGARRDVCDSPTTTMANFECHVTTINGGLAPHPPHRHPDEEILVLKEGALDVTIKGVTKRIGPGSIAFCASNDEHGWKNAGDTPATYYVIRIVTEKTPKPAPKG